MCRAGAVLGVAVSGGVVARAVRAVRLRVRRVAWGGRSEVAFAGPAESSIVLGVTKFGLVRQSVCATEARGAWHH